MEVLRPSIKLFTKELKDSIKIANMIKKILIWEPLFNNNYTIIIMKSKILL